MKTAILNKGKETKYLNGYPLIDDDDVYAHDHLKEGDLFSLVNDEQTYIATAYVGRQHKGLGWVLSYDENEVINTQFLRNFLKSQYKKERIFIILKVPMLLEYLMVKVMV